MSPNSMLEMGSGMASMIYGYVRGITGGQTTDLQQDTLVKAGRDRIFTDVASSTMCEGR